MADSGRWLTKLERKIGWLAVPQISILIVTLQALGFFAMSSSPAWFLRLALIPERVMDGELWRLITFLSIPLTMDPLWLFFSLWFLYFILNSLEQEWGAFKTTLYVLVSIVVTAVFSLAFGYPVTQARSFESTLFLAAAALFPEYEVRVFLVLPVKLKWMGFLTGAFVLLQFAQGAWMDRLYLVAMYFNFIVFFGPGVLQRLKSLYRRWDYRRKLR